MANVTEDTVTLDLNLYKHLTYQLEHYRTEQAKCKAFIVNQDLWQSFIAWKVAQRMEE